MTEHKLLDKCPKSYLKWSFVVVGMIVVFCGYLVYKNFVESDDYLNQDSDLSDVPTISQTAIIQTTAEEIVEGPSAFLGVELIAVDSVVAEQLGLSSTNGVLINKVIPNSPAQEAGLKRGDVIVAINNRTVKDLDRFADILADLNPGDRVRIVYIRDGKKDSTYALLAASSPLQQTAQTTIDDTQELDWGVALSPLSTSLRNSLNIPSTINGVVIVSVQPGGLADEAGLSQGDVITGIDKIAITDMHEFFDAIIADANNTALLDVYSQGQMRYVPIDSSNLQVIADQTQTQDTLTLRDKIFSIFTGGAPFASDDDADDEEGPKGGKFADDASSPSLVLTEHINEEDDYDKPVCKRLEETSERYDVPEAGYSGGI